MRLWSIHPRYLDAKGLTALWREGLLAQKVLHGQTRGYTRHPQLHRFRASSDPLATIALYLRSVVDEADSRGYSFDRNKIPALNSGEIITVTDGQLSFEKEHLLQKLLSRDPERWKQLYREPSIDCHPLFRCIPGDIEPWEVTE